MCLRAQISGGKNHRYRFLLRYRFAGFGLNRWRFALFGLILPPVLLAVFFGGGIFKYYYEGYSFKRNTAAGRLRRSGTIYWSTDRS